MHHLSIDLETYSSVPLACDLVRKRNLDGLRCIYGSVPDSLSQLIRTAFIAPEGHVLIDADFSAIETRVISWLAGKQWRLEVFCIHGKIYEASASQMFGAPIDLIKKGNPEYALRQKGKVAELALGCQGRTGALINMGTLDTGIPEEDLPDIVSRWRDATVCTTKLPANNIACLFQLLEGFSNGVHTFLADCSQHRADIAVAHVLIQKRCPLLEQLRAAIIHTEGVLAVYAVGMLFSPAS